MKETYETPEVETVEANVEKGFAATFGTDSPGGNTWDVDEEIEPC